MTKFSKQNSKQKKKDYTSTLSGKFSECLFSPNVIKRNRAVSCSSSLNSSSPSLFIHNKPNEYTYYGKRLSNSGSNNIPLMNKNTLTHNLDNKRLVNQFLELGLDQDKQRTKSSSSCKLELNATNESIIQILYSDLRGVYKSNFSNFDKINIEKENGLPDYEIPHYKSLKFEDFFIKEINKFECILKFQFFNILNPRDNILEQNELKLKSLNANIQALTNKLLEFKIEISSCCIDELNLNFNFPNSFIHQLESLVDEHLAELGEFENRIKNCKEYLNKQKESLKTMESMVKLKATIIDFDRNMRFFKKVMGYNGIIWDVIVLLTLLTIIYLLFNKILNKLT